MPRACFCPSSAISESKRCTIFSSPAKTLASNFAHVACAQDWFCTRSLNQSIIEDPGCHCAERKPCSAALPPTRPQISLPLGIPGIGVAASPSYGGKSGQKYWFGHSLRWSLSAVHIRHCKRSHMKNLIENLTVGVLRNRLGRHLVDLNSLNR
jgi:hypothetical protein